MSAVRKKLISVTFLCNLEAGDDAARRHSNRS